MAIHVRNAWGALDWAKAVVEGFWKFMHVICCTLHPHFPSHGPRVVPCRSFLEASSSPQATPLPAPISHTTDLISKRGCGAHGPVWTNTSDEGRVNGAWCKRGDTVVCSRLTAKLPIRQSSKALKHVLQAHLKHTLFPPSPLSTHTH